ncbi:WD40/YVTN/BNR-like repeat-containing protein [Daejeonella oryzae]|uniref:WD40/YVTN/BNR-like repeat-containing protein n=1 Tax=Daejeonella oryzae TaxID=1122943 RepID=UPI000412A859|nr:sialidase family protein [Daejeonella oryzae]
MKRTLTFFLVFCFSTHLVNAQKTQKTSSVPQPTSAATVLKGFEQRQKLDQESLVKNLKFKSVGPTVMSGRITDVDVNENDPTEFYAAYASGGLWHTVNNGISFEPVFDQEASMTIGDIAVDWKNNIIWIGTGENNSSRSSYAGNGIYKSTNGGKTWEWLGLPESHHIGRIVLDPDNAGTAWVAALGHLYSANKERGVYKTTDGGKTWKLTLFIDDSTGAVDLVSDPKNSGVLYATMWKRERQAWNFVEGGKTSGIYKSTDAGESWSLISTAASGFPNGEGVGRIGLAVYPQNPNIIYAILDNQSARKEDGKIEKSGKLSKDDLRNMSKNDFLKLENDAVTQFLKDNRFPSKYTAASVKKDILEDKIKPVALVEYLEDANTQMFGTAIVEAEVYRSDDAGKSWKKTNTDDLRGVYNTYGYYFGQIRVSPVNADKIYIMGVPIYRSDDGGKTFKNINGDNVHADHHALWVDPKKDGHIINGNDGGINISYDDGKNWFKANTPAVGQFYSVTLDMAKPYNIYGGLQDNGVWTGPSTYTAGYSWYDDGEYPYKRIWGGDGMQVAVDTRDNNLVYTGSQYGAYGRFNKTTKERMPFQPKHELGERPLRWNWESPVLISRHNQDVIYFGSNRFHRSLNKGTDFIALSGDLTKGGKPGDIAYGSLTSIDESPLKFGLIYAGSDDGLIHVSKDGGYTWSKISDKLPQNLWVSQVFASNFEEGTVYASLNGYRYDDFNSYIYKSADYGQNWTRIGTNLPAEPVNVVKQDLKNKDLLFAGTDHGLYISLNGGKDFMRFSGDLPAVSVHDLAIHPREDDLVIATHGRSLYMTDIKELQQLTGDVLQKDMQAFELKPVNFSANWGRKFDTIYEPEFKIPYFSKNSGKVTLNISTAKGLLLKSFTDTAEAGLNYADYDLSINDSKMSAYQNEFEKSQNISLKKADSGKVYLQPGKYLVEVKHANGSAGKQTLIISEGSRGQSGFEPEAASEPDGEAESK